MIDSFSTRFGRVDLWRIKRSAPGVAAEYVVSLDMLDIGTITKFRDTSSKKFPWVTYLGVGESKKLIWPIVAPRFNAIMEVVNSYASKTVTL